MPKALLRICILAWALTGCDSIFGPGSDRAGLWVQQSNLVASVGEEGVIVALHRPGQMGVPDSLPEAHWWSDDETVVEIDAGGRFRANAVGTAHIFVDHNGFSDSLTIRVTSEPRSYSTRWQTVAVADNTTCALTVGGEVYCWGDDYYGAIGDGVRRQWTHAHAPQTLEGNGRYAQVDVGWAFACALDTDGVAWCWGDRLAVPGAPDHVLSPTPVDASQEWTALWTGMDHTCALDGSGRA